MFAFDGQDDVDPFHFISCKPISKLYKKKNATLSSDFIEEIVTLSDEELKLY